MLMDSVEFEDDDEALDNTPESQPTEEPAAFEDVTEASVSDEPTSITKKADEENTVEPSISEGREPLEPALGDMG